MHATLELKRMMDTYIHGLIYISYRTYRVTWTRGSWATHSGQKTDDDGQAAGSAEWGVAGLRIIGCPGFDESGTKLSRPFLASPYFVFGAHSGNSPRSPLIQLPESVCLETRGAHVLSGSCTLR